MPHYVLSLQARRDLIDIWKYIAQNNEEAADGLYERFYQVFALLGKHPYAGQASDNIELGTRKFPVGNYIVYYRPKKRHVQILHVFHGKRDQGKAMKMLPLK